MEMMRTTIRTTFRSFPMLGRIPDENGGSNPVHIRLRMWFYSESTSGDVPEYYYLGEETMSFPVNLGRMDTEEQTSRQVLQQLNNSEFEPLFFVIDDITLALSEMIRRAAAPPRAVRADDPVVIASSVHVTFHADDVEVWEDAVMDFESPDDSQLVYEQPSRPASKASVDALERRKVEEQDEESRDDNVCAVCQGEVGRGDCMVKLPCSHEFHQECVLAWLQRAHSCPLCRYQLPSD